MPFLPKNKIKLVKSPNCGKNRDIVRFGQKSEFWFKKSNFWSKIKILVKNQNFGQKSKFWSKNANLVKQKNSFP